MCGIAGMISLTDKPLERPDVVQAMMDRLIHRGPDEEGHYVNPSRKVALGHRRLRIIDLTSGQQPLSNEDGAVTISFNGEIYGFQDLQKVLQERGHQFKTKSDTEVIVHLYEDEGTACLQNLKGMFVFALWDERSQSLLLARDRAGKKPLYYASQGGELYFASELRALLVVPGLSRVIDRMALDQYLTLGYIPAPHTIFRDVKKLEAGHSLTVNSGQIHQSRYWTPQSRHPLSIDFEEAQQEFVTRFRSATALRMVSDVPLGCFLSGGVDSSAVLSFMAELSCQPIKTFSIGFPEQEYSEVAHARLVARHFGTDHHEYVVEPDAVTILEQLVSHFGEPFADSSALPMWYLSQLTRQSVTVALTGDGGDELFGGYNWYRSTRLLDVASFVPYRIAKMLAHLPKGSRLPAISTVGNAARMLMLSAGERYAMQRQITTRALKDKLYSREFASETGSSALSWLAGQYGAAEADDNLNRAMMADLSTYMAEDLLVKVDRTSMAHSLECRSPFLDTDLIEWAVRLPSSYKIRSNRLGWPVPNGGKWVLREAVRNRLPPAFLDRPKQGFSVPLEYWFRGGMRGIVAERVVHGPLERYDEFNPEGLQWIVSEHFSGRANYAPIVWALLVLATWTESLS